MSKRNSRLSATLVARAFNCSAVVVIFSLSLTLAPKIISAQPLPLGLVELEGTLEVLHEDRDPGSRFIYYLRTAIERLELRFAVNAPALQTGDRVRARGRRSNGVLAVDSSSNVQTLAAALPNTFGAQKTLVMLVKFTDSDPAPDKPYSLSTAHNIFNTTSNFDLENSYNQTWMTGVTNNAAAADIVGWFTISQSSTACNYSTTASLADQAATAAGVNLSQYTRKIYAFPQNACSWWGLGTVGGNPSRSWINGSLQLRVVAHEMGHNFGLYHSHSLDCGAEIIGASCTSSDYGDGFDTMGSSAYHYNAYQKERLGWLDYNLSPPITDVTTDGVYSIAPYETDTDEPKALKVIQFIDGSGRRTNYYLEFRRPIGFDAGLSSNGNVTNGVLVHLGTESSGNTSYLLDMTPQTSSWSDPALSVGQSYSDPSAGVTFTVLSANAAGADVSVTFSGGGTSTCVRAAPSMSLTPSSQNTLAGGTLSYTVNLTNADTSSCGSTLFSLSGVAPSGWTKTVSPSSFTLAPGENGQATLSVISPSSAGAGNYTVTVDVDDSAYPDHAASQGATYEVTTPDSEPPTAPAGLTASVKRKQINLAWTASTDNIAVSGYTIWRNGQVLASTGGTSYVDRSATSGNSYSYYVIAADQAGNQSASSNTATVDMTGGGGSGGGGGKSGGKGSSKGGKT